MKERKNLVLGAVHGYKLAQLEPFARSLRDAGFKGDVIFLTHSVSEEVQHQLWSQFQIECRPIHYRGAGSFNSWSRFWARLRLLRAIPFWARLDQRILSASSDFAIRRFLCALELLEERDYAGVFFTDVRDVWFQSDPFTGMSPGCHVFLEAPWMNYDESEMNREWIQLMYGKEYLERLAGTRVSCCGTILGDGSAMRAYFSAFLKLLAECRQLVHGADTAVHNRIIFEQHVSPLKVWENGEGAVLTINNRMDPTRILSPDGTLRRPDGGLIPVLHQYDRLPAIESALFGKLGSKPGPITDERHEVRS